MDPNLHASEVPKKAQNARSPCKYIKKRPFQECKNNGPGTRQKWYKNCPKVDFWSILGIPRGPALEAFGKSVFFLASAWGPRGLPKVRKWLQNRPPPKTLQRDLKIDPKLKLKSTQNRSKMELKMEPKMSPKMIQKWFKNDSKINQNRFKNCTKTNPKCVQKWTHNGCTNIKNIKKCIQNGSKNELISK